MAYNFICRLSPNNKVVRNNLAMTPAQVYESYKRGIPVSLSSLDVDSFVEQSKDADYSVPLEYRRGVDLNMCFEQKQNIDNILKRDKLRFKEVI